MVKEAVNPQTKHTDRTILPSISQMRMYLRICSHWKIQVLSSSFPHWQNSSDYQSLLTKQLLSYFMYRRTLLSS